MKWSDKSIFQLIKLYEKTNFCKIRIHLCFFSSGIIHRLSVSWFLASDNRRLFPAPKKNAEAPETGACYWPMCHQLK